MMRDTLISLLTPTGVSGAESPIASAIEAMVKPYVDEIKTDALGNLIAIKRGPGKRVMLAAHMDQIGFIITDIDDNGFLRFMPIGGVPPQHYIYRQMVFPNGRYGVVGIETEHEDFKAVFPRMFIDVGATSRAEAEAHFRIGDTCAPVPTVVEMGGRISAPAMDDRVGCAVVVEALKQLKGGVNEVCAVFTVQEEVGTRGAGVAAFDYDADYGIALDVTMVGDTPKAARMAVSLGKGPAIKVMDLSLICHPRVRAMLEDTAARLGMAVQYEVLHAGGTDAGKIQITRGGIPSGVISIPCRYVHSPAEVIDIADAENAARLLAGLLDAPIA